MKVLIIKWRDCCGQDGPFMKEETPGLMTMTSAGIFVRQDKEQVTICQDFWTDFENKYRDVIVIPKIIFLKLRKLRYQNVFWKGGVLIVSNPFRVSDSHQEHLLSYN